MLSSNSQPLRLLFAVVLIAMFSILPGCGDPEALPNATLSSTPGAANNKPPSASFTSNCSGLDCSVDASTSADTDGSIVSYAWDFGDSSNGTNLTANHTYSADGSYTIMLTVTDDAGATSSSSQTVFVSNGNLAPVVSFTSNCPNLSCNFDASASSDSDGSIVSYGWDFGDSTNDSGITVSHTYAADGSYTVTIIVTDNGGANSTGSQTVLVSAAGGGNNPPSASFIANCTNLVCNFDASASSDSDGAIVNYAWDFGDSTGGSGATPNHTYTADGVFTVVLTVTDNAGSQSNSNQSLSVSSGNNSPAASFSSNCTELSCDFDASVSSDSDGSIVSYDWDFGDSTNGTGITATHNYTNDGSYSVVLTVTDDGGASSNSVQSVTVSAVDGQAFYTSKCSTCHGADALGGTLAKIDIRGKTASDISNAIATIAQMNSLASTTSSEIQALADYLATL